jgi:hypothetical protein
VDGPSAQRIQAGEDEHNEVSGIAQSALEQGASVTALSLEEVRDAPAVWKQLADSCADAWFWHTWANMQFNFVAAQQYEPVNLSFFVMLNEKPVGIVPLMVNRTTIGNASGWEASYYGAPLPWPAFLDIPELEALEKFAFAEIEARARMRNAERIRLRLEPPLPSAKEGRRLERAVREHNYLDSSFESHFMELNEDCLNQVRERYRRYVRKFGPGYQLSIADGDEVTEELVEQYFRLHVADAGGQFRSRESYTLQADLARQHEAFFVVARQLQANRIVGMLLISLVKGSAYDNSVAVDPDFQEEYVSHLLKWQAIEELLRSGARGYELGPKAYLPRFMALPSEKNLGISHFKEGWARSGVRKVTVAEKFLSTRFLQAFMKVQSDEVQKHLGLP